MQSLYLLIIIIINLGGGAGAGGGANKVNLGDVQMGNWGIPKYYFTLLTTIKGIYHATAFFRCGFR